jgi:hypothetical protein
LTTRTTSLPESNSSSSITVNNSLTSSINNTGGQQPTQNISLNTNISVNVQIPTWIRNNAMWWSEGVITDTEFAQGIQFLVQERIIVMPQSTSNSVVMTGHGIPSWVKNDARWWSHGEMSDNDFVKGMQYMVQNGYSFKTSSATATSASYQPSTSILSSSTSSAQAFSSSYSSSASASASSSNTISLVSLSSSQDTNQTQSDSSVSQSTTDTSTSNTSTTNSTVVSTPNSTTVTIIPNPAIINQGSQATFTVTVTDTSSSPTTPTGIISWSDGNAGGIFNSSSCTLSSTSCTISYTPAANSPSGITITASYGGDSVHSVSTATSTLTINQLHSTTTTIIPNPATVNRGSQTTFTVTVTDTSSSPTTPTGTISWSDGNVGGTFSSTSCLLSSDSCTISYTPATTTNSPNSVTVTATYGGDSAHSGSTSTSQLSMNVLPASLLLTTDQSYYAYGDVVTLSVNLPGQSLQNIAVGVSNPNGDNIISRTITTDQNGTGALQFKIPDTYQTGLYQDVATALVDGKNYTTSTEFTVIKSHGISIDSVQITNQQGTPMSMLKAGQNGFVKVSISSGEKMPALVTLNLFDANQSSLGTASIKSVVTPGDSQMTLSFFIPSNSQVGLANVFTDAYSDWPSNGGTPLTTESCLATDLQNPSTLPVSYVPNPPHSCTTSPPSGSGLTSGTSGIQQVAMTNNQAQVTLGVAIQNDTMTFMSPAEAHLLALAYANGIANTQNNSIALVSLNLNNMSSTVPSTMYTSGNVTTIGPAQFTTIAGSDIQNNPMALKILQEIQASKQQVANIIGNETATKLNQQLVLQQRLAAADQLKQSLTALAQANSSTTPDVAYASFLTTVSDNRTQAVFQNEYNFMKQRVDASNAAMQTVLNNGGSLDQALLTFNQYATVNHAQMISLNNELNVAYGLADSRIQSCFNSNGQLTVINGVNPCVANIENNSTGPSGISIVSVQPTDQQGNPVSLIKRGQTGYVKVVIDSSASAQSLVTLNLFDSNISSLGTISAQYTLNPGQSEVVLPYYVPAQSGTGLASIYANVFTDWPNKGGTSQTNELSYFVGLS